MSDSITFGESTIAVHRRAGTDPAADPVVLLHPWFGCWQFWRQTMEALPEFDTISVDLYSLGRNADWAGHASPHGLASAVVAMLDALGIPRCSLVGNSMGGIAAQVLASSHPGRVGRLVLVGTGARTVGVKPDFRRDLDRWIDGGEDRAFTERLVASLLARKPHDPAEFESFVSMVATADKTFMGTVLRNAFETDLRPDLAKITAATLVVRGDLDAARTQAHVDEILAGIPNARAVEIPQGGHSPQVDSPEAFNAAIRDFLLPGGG